MGTLAAVPRRWRSHPSSHPANRSLSCVRAERDAGRGRWIGLPVVRCVRGVSCARHFGSPTHSTWPVNRRPSWMAERTVAVQARRAILACLPMIQPLPFDTWADACLATRARASRVRRLAASASRPRVHPTQSNRRPAHRAIYFEVAENRQCLTALVPERAAT